MRVLLETLDIISVSHFCEWTWIAMAIVCACGGSDLYVILYGEFSLKDTSGAISANVIVWKLPILLITMGIIWTMSLFILMCLGMACSSGSYILCMLVMVARVFVSVEYLHSMSCRHLLPF